MNNPARSDPALWLDRHGDALYAFALGRVRNVAVAEDLVQDTLLAAFSSRDAFRGDSAERTWLTGILKHKVLDYLRRRGREVPLVEERDYPADVEAECFDDSGHWRVDVRHWSRPDRALEQEELRAALQECIGRLPDKQGTLFVLREVDGMETDELIAALNISSPGNLWVMLSRARMRLRACLEEKSVQPGN